MPGGPHTYVLAGGAARRRMAAAVLAVIDGTHMVISMRVQTWAGFRDLRVYESKAARLQDIQITARPVATVTTRELFFVKLTATRLSCL